MMTHQPRRIRTAPTLESHLSDTFPTLKLPRVPQRHLADVNLDAKLPTEIIIMILESLEPHEQWATRGVCHAFHDAAHYLVERRVQHIRMYLCPNDGYSKVLNSDNGICDFVLQRWDELRGVFVFVPHRKRHNFIRNGGDYRVHVNDLSKDEVVAIWDLDIFIGVPRSPITLAFKGNLIVSYSTAGKDGKDGKFEEMLVAPERIFRALKPQTVIKRQRAVKSRKQSGSRTRCSFEEAFNTLKMKTGNRYSSVLYAPENRNLVLDCLSDVRNGNAIDSTEIMRSIKFDQRNEFRNRCIEVAASVGIVIASLSWYGKHIQ
jgi:hypothetical protein